MPTEELTADIVAEIENESPPECNWFDGRQTLSARPF